MALQRINPDLPALAPPALQALLMRDLTIGQLRTASPLPEDSQRLIDQAVVRVGMDRLTVVSDLFDEGLTFPIDDPLGVIEVQWDVVGRSGYAHRAMDPRARGENQLPARSSKKIPVYLTMDDFFLGIRTLRASQRSGIGLDVGMVEDATRNVNEAIEDAAINGVPFTVNGNGAPGLLNAPNVNTFAYGSGEAWTAAGHDGADILADVQGMIDLLQTARRFGPYNLYVNTAYGNKLQSDFKANGDETIQERLERIQAGGRPLRIRVADQLPANRVVLVQMTRDVIDVIDGQAPTSIPWTSADGFTLHWLVLGIQVPRVKTDSGATSGIVTGNLTLP